MIRICWKNEREKWLIVCTMYVSFQKMFLCCRTWLGLNLLKEQLHEIFDPRFFSSINPTWGPDSRPKAVLHMASYSPRKLIIFEFQRCHLHRWNAVHGVTDTAETISAGSMTPLKRFQRWNDQCVRSFAGKKYDIMLSWCHDNVIMITWKHYHDNMIMLSW
jgi:hypothetical protein